MVMSVCECRCDEVLMRSECDGTLLPSASTLLLLLMLLAAACAMARDDEEEDAHPRGMYT